MSPDDFLGLGTIVGEKLEASLVLKVEVNCTPEQSGGITGGLVGLKYRQAVVLITSKSSSRPEALKADLV